MPTVSIYCLRGYTAQVVFEVNNGMTALQVASFRGHIKIVQLLVEKEVAINAQGEH
jgi:hypothetical protein